MAIKNVTKGKKVEVAKAKGPARIVRVNKGEAAKRPAVRTLYFFNKVPAGNILRAYTLGLITAQIGGIKAGIPFRLWPGANFRTHLEKEEIVKVGKGLYKLTPSGAVYFSEGVERAGKDKIAAMANAVRTGKTVDFYSYPLSPMSVE